MFKLLLILLPFFILPNEPTYNQVARIEFKADGFTTDNLGNVYLRKAEELKKYNQDGKLLNPYSDKSLGKVSSVDATNFLKLVVFYRDFSKIVFLDNMLAPTGEPIQLQRLELEQATLAASSHNNGLWLYHQFEFKLIRLGQNLKPSHQTPNLMQLMGYQMNPNFLLEVNNMVFLNNPETGILLFDIFGTYNKTIPIRGLESFQVIGNEIFYFLNKEFRSYNLKTLEESRINLPEAYPIDVRIEKKRLFVLSKDALTIYAL
ncbi:MAG: hypothetical protein H0X62_07225 [Bacteroidetes bacterium]|nr:hypothetical protein [Bacteroidota bacterium]